MLKNFIFLMLLASPSLSAEIDILGNVQSKCIIQVDRTGVYGNPTANKLTTASASGGVMPIIRYDVSLADYYIAKIIYPTSFSSSPALNDVVNWTGSASVTSVSDAGMSVYDTNKVAYNATTEFDLTIAGSTWFGVESVAEYGYNRAFPGGTYRAVIQAECIAK